MPDILCQHSPTVPPTAVLVQLQSVLKAGLCSTGTHLAVVLRVVVASFHHPESLACPISRLFAFRRCR
jgi:hypothetical protein